MVLSHETIRDRVRAANDVLHGAVSGIAEVINNPGLVNVDFADVRTVMGEIGMAMMGSATAAGTDRSRSAAQQAVKSPLLEDVNLAGARGVLVNITASSGLKMKEYHDVMNTIKEFTAEDAMVIVGTVIDDEMEDRLRVTMIATGLGGAAMQGSCFGVGVHANIVTASLLAVLSAVNRAMARTGMAAGPATEVRRVA